MQQSPRLLLPPRPSALFKSARAAASRLPLRRKLDEKRVLDVREYVKTIEDRLEDEIKV